MDGVINIIKPPGMTSSNVVVDVRRLFHVKKVGHTGTLDPGAAGVLPICIGKATKLFDYLVNKDKEYVCEIAFGSATDTFDAYGAITDSGRNVSKAELLSTLNRFIGPQEQLPPMFSAVNYQGKKLYQLAREGQTVVPEERRRKIDIYALDFIEQTMVNRFLFHIHCSKGTYIRTLCMDIAGELQTCAYMSFLLRTRAGPFALESALTLAQAEKLRDAGALETAIMPVEQVLRALPEVCVNKSMQKRILNGNPIEQEFVDHVISGDVRIYCDGLFIGIGTFVHDLLTIKTMFADTSKKEV